MSLSSLHLVKSEIIKIHEGYEQTADRDRSDHQK